MSALQPEREAAQRGQSLGLSDEEIIMTGSASDPLEWQSRSSGQPALRMAA